MQSINSNEYSRINEATEQVHVAVQFLSMAGKFFLPPQSDDSQTNTGWDMERQWFFSHPLLPDRPLCLCLRPHDLHLLLVENTDRVLAEFSLPGKTQQEGLEWVKSHTHKLGLAAEKYKIDLHYELPPYAEFNDQRFSAQPPEAFKVFSQVRTWGELVLAPYQKKYAHASPLRTWPHHFDHGTYVPLAFDEKGEAVKSIGLGLAIHDQTIGEHYFYITHWDQKGKVNYDHLPALPHGHWNRNEWTGAVLPFSEILKIDDPKKQLVAANIFMQDGIKASLDLLKLTQKIK